MYPKLISLFLSLVITTIASAQSAHEYHTLDLKDGSKLRYALVLPNDFDADKTYPALLAMPAGLQTQEMVENGLLFWGRRAAKRGWIVVSPVAPDGTLFFRGSEVHIPQLLDHIQSKYKIEYNKFHIAGHSSGGRSSFRVAGLNPDRFLSLTVLPGYPPNEDDVKILSKLKGLPINMFAGVDDIRWAERTIETKQILDKLGIEATTRVFPGEEHFPQSLKSPVIFDLLNSIRKEIAPASVDEQVVSYVLDQLHDAASKADGERYFSLFAPDAVFLGTDATERWTKKEFQAYAKPHFDAGTGWTYHMRKRNIFIDDDASTAWFDEVLHNEKYGECRGTGVLVKLDDGWKIAQYNLMFPIPNDIAADVIKMIKENDAAMP